MEPKATKDEANYRAGTMTRRCELCTMWEPPSSCSSVRGAIGRAALCDYYKAKGALLKTEQDEINQRRSRRLADG